MISGFIALTLAVVVIVHFGREALKHDPPSRWFDESPEEQERRRSLDAAMASKVVNFQPSYRSRKRA